MTVTNSEISDTQLHPAAPWTLQGQAIVSLHAVDVNRVRPFLPPGLEAVQILPGKMLGGIYVSTYGDGSVLKYNELIAFCGPIRCGDRLGSWVTHIYVDDPTSVAGGRNIWGLPKQMADFQWTKGDQSQATVHRGEQLLCRVNYGWQAPGVLPVSLPSFLGSFSTLESSLVWFAFQGSATPQLLMGTEVEIPELSPLAALNLGKPMAAFHLSDLLLTVHSPIPVQQ
ncbi:MAG: acetoacetate decarboxylase family protein [Elainellaceae cyanobacterium]